MKVSQSALRDFYNEDFCKVKWEEMYINNYRTKPTAAMIDGLFFEQNVIGESRGGEVYNIPKLKTGKPSKRETDLLKLSKFAKQTIKDLEIELIDVQPEWSSKELIGHPDALIKYKGELAILDLKYTAIKETESARFNPYAWSDLEYKDFSQAIHYIELYKQMYDIYLPFFYLVFGKSGWVKFICIDLTKKSLDEYKDKIKRFQQDFKTFKPVGINNYETCRKCPIMCNERIYKPQIITVEC